VAKTDGTQDIPSELLDAYRATLGEETPRKGVEKRYPFQVPHKQDGRGNVTAGQRIQRDRFKIAISDFAKELPAERARWYAAMPAWSSFLWYYNYYIMSDLSGNANQDAGGVGVIKSIQFKTVSMPAAGGEGEVAITAIDINKAVVMLFGGSINNEEGEAWFRSSVVYPYVSSLASELVKCKWSLATIRGEDTLAADIGIIVIEYI